LVKLVWQLKHEELEIAKCQWEPELKVWCLSDDRRCVT
jgi:hypothetical protein